MPYRDDEGNLYTDDGRLLTPVDDDEGENDQQDAARKPNWRRDLEKQARKGKDSEAALTVLQRENAFLKAGIDVEDPKLSYFAKAYDGDLSAKAIKEAAESAGFLTPTADVIPDGEKAAHGRISDPTGAAPTVRDFNAEIAAASTPAEVVRIMQEAGGIMADGAVVPQ